MKPTGSLVLRLVSYVVPSSLRDEWLREWQTELYYSWDLDGKNNRSRLSAYARCLGALEDAAWLRLRNRNRGMVRQDIRYALRSFAKHPAFTFVVLLTLALGIGANTAIFTLVDAVLLRPLPVAAPSELVDLYTTCRAGFPYCSSSYPDVQDYRERNRTMVGMAAFTGMQLGSTGGTDTRLLTTSLVTGNYFELLGIQAALGRLIIQSDDRLGDPQTVAVLSHRMWQNEYGGDRAVLGRDIRLNGALFTIVGVTPQRFRGTRLSSNPDLWIPFASFPTIATGSDVERDVLSERTTRWIGGLIGRRLPGVTVEQVRDDMLAVSQGMQEEFPRLRGGRSVTIEPTRTYTLPARAGEDIVRFVTLLMVVVGAALLIACANIANLLLARASARRREIGVRIALGAGRGRLVAQLLTESLLLSFVGAAGGLLVANTALGFLSQYALPGFVSLEVLDLQLDVRVLTFTGVVAVLTGLLFGLAPALQTASPSVIDALKEQAPDGRTARLMRTRGILLAVQTALALTLLIGAGLFIRSLRHGLDSDVGFETRSLAMASFDLGLQRYDEPRARELLRAITERAQKFPTVTHVTSAVYPPLARGGSGFFISIDGYTPYEGEELRIEANWVGPSYFEAMGVPLSSGRDIAAGDRDGAPLVAVINETMARRWWAGEDPVGRTFRVGAADAPQVLIVGVARDVKDGLVEDPEPFIHLPLDQHLQRALNQQFVMLVGTAGPADAILPSLRTELRELDRELALQELTTLDNRFAEFLMPQRMGSTLLATLGGLTVLLAIVGISGVVGYAVNQRRRELGIRIALGASPSHILATTIRSALIPIGVGLGVGIVIALATTRLITNFMYTIAPTDVPTFVTIPLLMAVVAAAAAYLPARRAMSVNPTEALRNE